MIETHIGVSLATLRARIQLVVVGLSLAVSGSAGCSRSDAGRTDPTEVGALEVRDVRVLVASGVELVRVVTAGTIGIVGGDGTDLGRRPAEKWIIIKPEGPDGFRIGADRVVSRDVTLTPERGGSSRLSVYRKKDWSVPIQYPGRLQLKLGEKGGIDVVNLTDVERYVACVVANEVWPTFETEAYRTQAIVARTYVLHQMDRRRSAEFDVRASQGSQVYRGIRSDVTGRRAAAAASFTRGVVCAWRDGGGDVLYSTYYSAACGGVSQSAAIFGQADDIAPLGGGVHCDYCRIAPGDTYRWGPVRIPAQEVLARLVRRYPDFRSLSRITAITPVERTSADRAVRLRITGTNGRSREILAERFRVALNGMVVRSTDCDIRVAGPDVVFEKGKGFGHGLGLCQWGMQGQALAGKKAGEILRYYYPGCRIMRAY